MGTHPRERESTTDGLSGKAQAKTERVARTVAGQLLLHLLSRLISNCATLAVNIK